MIWLFVPIVLLAQVSVSILPQKFIVDQISGHTIQVHTLLPKSATPANYTLSPKDIEAIKRSRLYLRLDLPFERANLKRIASLNPKLTIVDMSRYVAKFPLDHHHETPSAASLDPHTWLAPPQLMLLARATLQELLKLYPERRDTFLANYEGFIAKLLALDRKAIVDLSQLHSRRFVVYHPSFGYFAKVYDLEQIPIEVEGKEPSARGLRELLSKAKGAQVLIIEPQFPKRSATFIAKRLGLRVVTIDPLAYDLFQTIERLIHVLAHRR